MRGLTFELTWRQRNDARPALQKMHACTVARAWWHAVGSQVERGVRQHWLHGEGGAVFLCRAFCFPQSATARAVAVFRVCGTCQELCMALRALQRPAQGQSRGHESVQAPRTTNLHSSSRSLIRASTSLTGARRGICAPPVTTCSWVWDCLTLATVLTGIRLVPT